MGVKITTSTNLGLVTSSGGNVSVTGTGGGTTSNTNYGVDLQGTITAGGNGAVVVSGTAGFATSVGVALSSTGSILSTNGTIAISGTGNGTSAGVQLNRNTIGSATSGDISITGTALGSGSAITSVGTSGVTIGAAGSSSNVTLSGDSITATSIANGFKFNAAGSVTMQPVSASFSTSPLIQTNKFLLSASTTAFTVGKPGNTSALTVTAANTYAISGPITLYGNGLTLDGSLTATGNTISLINTGSGAITQTGILTGSGLRINSVGGSATLTAANKVGTLASSGTSSLTFSDSAALTIGTVGSTTGISATGAVSVSTTADIASHNLTIASNVSTTNTGGTAIQLTAGAGFTAGTDGGSNIVVSGSPTLTVGSGGRALLFTGALSSDLSSLVPSGNYRYNADSTATTPALGASGIYGIYRKGASATVTVTMNNVTKTYDGSSFTGASGYSITGLAPGDTPGGTLVYGGTGIGVKNVGTYTITGSGLTGFVFTYVPGTLTINPASLSLSGTQVYNGGTAFAGANLTATGVAGETFAVTGTGASGNLSSKNVQTAQPLATVTGLALGTSSNGGVAGNYNALSTTGSSVSVTRAPLTITTSNVTKTYDGNTTAVGTATGAVQVGDSLSGGTFAFTDKNAGSGNKTVTVSGVTVNDGNSGNNYTVGYANNTTSTINPANVTITGTQVYNAAQPLRVPT